MSDESMTDVSYCECNFRLPEQGGLYCAYCGKIILTQDSKDEAEPLMNDDDIYFDELIWPEPPKGEPIHAKINAPTIRPEFPIQPEDIGLSPEDLSTVPVDRALLVQLARLVYRTRMADLLNAGYSIDDASALQTACEQILREHDHD